MTKIGSVTNLSAMIQGVNITFYIATGLSAEGLFLSFYIEGTTPKEERAAMKVARGE